MNREDKIDKEWKMVGFAILQNKGFGYKRK